MSESDALVIANKIAACAAAVLEATKAHADAAQAASHASNRETDALNKLNQAQKAFDQAVADSKASAPHRSDWAIERARAERLRPVHNGSVSGGGPAILTQQPQI